MTTTIFFYLLMFQVRGVVSDSSGRPVEGAHIACGAETKTTDARGAFELTRACDATVTKPGFAEQQVPLSATSENSIRLGLASASDRVVVTATRAPLAVEESGVAADVFTA